MTRHPAEAQAVEDACKALLGGGTLSGVMREWAKAGLVPPQSKTGRWTRTSIRTILLNPGSRAERLPGGDRGHRPVGTLGE